MNRARALSLVVLASGLLGVAQADTLQMGGTDNAARFEQAGKPVRGMTQARVEAEFGTPNSRQSAVGDPPISRWDYADFAVFFEYDRVIHAVSKR
ncbi:MAG: hypothetical protein KDI09_20370 [Halioglobus sp.]|nr:hypothetical protein [Halioglobus sp.]